MDVFDLEQNQLSDEMTHSMSKQVDGTPEQTRTAVNRIVSTLVSAISKNAQKPGGADAMFSAINRDHDGGGSVVDDLLNMGMKSLFKKRKYHEASRISVQTMTDRRRSGDNRRFSSALGKLFISLLLLLTINGCTQNAQQVADEQTAGDDPWLQSLNTEISRHPGRATLYAERAAYHRDIGNYGDAILDMYRAMDLDSINLQFHFLLSDIYLRSMRSQLALTVIDRAVQLFPDSISAQLKYAELQLILRQYDMLSVTLRQVLEREPQNIEALFLLGMMYQEQDNLPRATLAFQTIVEIDSEQAEAWNMLGNLYDLQGDPKALQCFENAVRVDPNYPQGWHSKAFYLQNNDRIEEAIAIYEHIHTIDSAYTDAWLNEGILYLELGDTESAADRFSTLVRIDSTSSPGYFFLGVTAEQRGDKAAARTYYRKAARLDPASQRIRDALIALDQ